MVVIVTGKMGKGKSVSTIALLHRDSSKYGRRIIANCTLNDVYFPGYTKLDIEYFLEHIEDEEMENSSIFLDEAYIYLDSRSSSNKLNKLFTYFTVQTRKMGVDLYVAAHHLDIVDKRIRRAANLIGECQFDHERPCKRCKGTGEDPREKNPETGEKALCIRCKGYGEGGYAITKFTNKDEAVKNTLKVWGPTYWPMYNTKERVPFLQRQTQLVAGDY